MNRIAMVLVVLALVTTSGCAGMTYTEQTTLSGAAIGAAGGAVIGAAAGNPAAGAAIGGAAGAATGLVIGEHGRGN